MNESKTVGIGVIAMISGFVAIGMFFLTIPFAIVAFTTGAPWLGLTLLSYMRVRVNDKTLIGLPAAPAVAALQATALTVCAFVLYPDSVMAKVYLAAVVIMFVLARVLAAKAREIANNH